MNVTNQEWMNAQVACLQHGGQLAIIDSEDKLQFIKDYLVSQWSELLLSEGPLLPS